MGTMSYMGHHTYTSRCGGSCSDNYSPSARDLAEPGNMFAYSQGRNLVTGEHDRESVGGRRANHADYKLGTGILPQYAGSATETPQSYNNNIPTIRILM